MAALSPDNAFEWFPSLQAARFNVWAQRGVHVVWSDATLQAMADFLGNRLPQYSRDRILLLARNALGERTQYWKAEVRRCRADRETEKRRIAAPTAPATAAEPPVARRESRAAVIRPMLKSRGLTPGGWAIKAGVDSSVVYDFLAGKSNPRPDSRKVLAEALGITELPD